MMEISHQRAPQYPTDKKPTTSNPRGVITKVDERGAHLVGVGVLGSVANLIQKL
jgi:hypothetical protein